MIAFSMFWYFLLAVLAGFFLKNQQKEQGDFHKVEINRIYHSLSGQPNPDKLDLRWCKSIKKVSYITVDEEKDMDAMMNFCKTKAGISYEIRPWYNDYKLDGYLRFDYKKAEENNIHFFIVEAALFFMEAMILVLLIYFKVHLLQPFHKMSHLPYEIAKGHLKEDVKDGKEKYFGKFLWGISQLKDTLDVTKKWKWNCKKRRN